MINPEIEALLRRSETARRRLAYDLAALKHRVDVPARMKESLQTNPTGWIGGSLVTGLLASFALRRKKPKRVEEKVRRAGLTGLLLTAGGALIKPALKSLATNYLQRTLASRLGSRHDH
ncbi:hypothetical protein llg_38240 [Luteolibacter sp. LG18]|nr:hypothetical protein llg_38240 [Luteolibacter sp. LG18]